MAGSRKNREAEGGSMMNCCISGVPDRPGGSPKSRDNNAGS